MSSLDEDTKREELLSYREEVLRELGRRVDRVKEVDARIAATQYEVDSAQRDRVPAGQTLRLLAQVSYRQRLKKQIEAQRRDRQEALEDLQRAQVRLADVDNELLELDESLVVKSPPEG
jgi:hypothetical protein